MTSPKNIISIGHASREVFSSKEIIEFDTLASKLGLDGEQMDEIRDFIRNLKLSNNDN